MIQKIQNISSMHSSNNSLLIENADSTIRRCSLDISILIVTRNRVGDLKKTLQSMTSVEVPEHLQLELLVVDNGSTDETAEVVNEFIWRGITVRYIYEGNPGLSNGRNRALAEASGKVILFTDDDVRLPTNWIFGMCGPIISGSADVVVGGIKIAPGLQRPWMTMKHRSFLASSEILRENQPQNMVGANMAFSTKVLHHVPGFDPALGAGALGSGEESLFFHQLQKMGAIICGRLDVCIEHHFDPERLTRKSLLDAAAKMGVSDAYRGHHWAHWGYRLGRLRFGLARLKLVVWRTANRASIVEEGCREEELEMVYHQALLRGHIEQHKMPRNYEKYGLVKLKC